MKTTGGIKLESSSLLSVTDTTQKAGNGKDREDRNNTINPRHLTDRRKTLHPTAAGYPFFMRFTQKHIHRGRLCSGPQTKSPHVW